MDRHRTALVLLLAVVVCAGVAIGVSGSRPGLEQDTVLTAAARRAR